MDVISLDGVAPLGPLFCYSSALYTDCWIPEPNPLYYCHPARIFLKNFSHDLQFFIISIKPSIATKKPPSIVVPYLTKTKRY